MRPQSLIRDFDRFLCVLYDKLLNVLTHINSQLTLSLQNSSIPWFVPIPSIFPYSTHINLNFSSIQLDFSFLFLQIPVQTQDTYELPLQCLRPVVLRHTKSIKWLRLQSGARCSRACLRTPVFLHPCRPVIITPIPLRVLFFQWAHQLPRHLQLPSNHRQNHQNQQFPLIHFHSLHVIHPHLTKS